MPTEADLHRWQVQVTYDVFTRNGVQPHPEDLANHDQLCHIASVILPDAAFDTSEGRSLVEDHEGEVPVTWLFIGGDAWEAAMAKRLAGHGAPHLADTLREHLRRGELPTRAEQLVCHQVNCELMLRQWIEIAICEYWTVRRGAEIGRNARTYNPDICNWLNSHGDPSRLGTPDPTPAAESAQQTLDRCRRQPLIHR